MALGHAKGLALQLAEGETRGAVEYDVVEGITGPAAHGAKPRIGEFPGRKGIGRAGGLKVAFDAEHPWTVLPVVAGLHAAHETGRLGRIVVDRTPVPADIAAEIGPGPAVHIELLIDGIGRARSVRQIGSRNR